ncbi:Nucleotide-binding universal stress protein, UspA family [Modestobacter sp. DSM 44400]|uniref:universal stress protein n=1 Tax=Modestobacter sp. DSM 44400 TaxID=1550230 RepID=UPI00089AD9A8|nr:universal stress protein [Modestobacter sp. DSM 44400]SDY79138.1 Nucleotide-binding universal stress protein, UspA family [Modestobacter sp. DSM 44400]
MSDGNGGSGAGGASGDAVLVADSAGQAAPRTTLVLGFDRDEASDAALAVAVDLADRLQAHLAVVHVVNLGDYPVDPDTPGWEDQARETLAEERGRVERALHGHRFGWSYEAWFGSPVDSLVRVAETRDAFMVVVGRHGHGVSEGLRRLIDGSVSRRLIKTCGRPVLVVPHDG